jgi:alpha-tubulin suppressor-like RCC1 family protein
MKQSPMRQWMWRAEFRHNFTTSLRRNAVSFCRRQQAARALSFLLAVAMIFFARAAARRAWAQETPSGQVIAWGLDSIGQATVPKDARSGVTAIAAGAFHNLALKDGQVIAWGQNTDGQVDVPEEARSGVTAIAAGFFHSLALKNGKVIAWGRNTSGQLKVPKEALDGVTAIAAGDTHSLALKGGQVIAWGSSLSGILKVPKEAQSGVSAIAAGQWHGLALKNGKVIAWGSIRVPADDVRKYPDGIRKDAAKLVAEEARSGVTAIAAESGVSLALKGGKVLAWSHEPMTIPVGVPDGMTRIAAGGSHYLGIRNGQVIAWGDNRHGQAMVPAAAQSGVIAIAGGYGHSLALKLKQ